jgi:uncharacterized membrane protein
VVHALMAKLGFTRIQADYAAFIKQSIVIFVYVDDIFLFIITKELIAETKSQLILLYNISDLGPL